MLSAPIQAGVGLLQTIIGSRRAKNSERRLEAMESPKYTQNKSILDYYQKALDRYNPNAYLSAAYRQGQQNIGSNLTAGISASQDRRSGLSAISNLVAQSNRASLGNIANAENIQSRALGQLGGAANMKAGDDRMAFNINEQQPFERKFNLLAQKASGGNKLMGAGLSNLFNGLKGIDEGAENLVGALTGGIGGAAKKMNKNIDTSAY